MRFAPVCFIRNENTVLLKIRVTGSIPVPGTITNQLRFTDISSGCGSCQNRNPSKLGLFGGCDTIATWLRHADLPLMVRASNDQSRSGRGP